MIGLREEDKSATVPCHPLPLNRKLKAKDSSPLMGELDNCEIMHAPSSKNEVIKLHIDSINTKRTPRETFFRVIFFLKNVFLESERKKN